MSTCAKRHRYRAKDHNEGCAIDPGPHLHVGCRRCGFEWLQLALFVA